MKLAITGASGFVGSEIIPALRSLGVDMLLISRNPAELKRKYPWCESASYADWEDAARGFDCLLHLAGLNNDRDWSDAEFHSINVEWTLAIAAQAHAAGIQRFLNISSVHALDPGNASGYAASKRLAAQRLETIEGLQVTTLFLPLVYGQRWSGKLKVLNRLPPRVARWLFKPIAALKPTMHIDLLVRELLGPSRPKHSRILSDGQQDNPYYLIFSRLLDWSFAAAILLLFWWGMAIIWALIRMQSRGPGIFAQERVGLGGASFICYKFRTMRVDTPQAGTHEVASSAITPLGRFLRRTKLDELPQILNILRGDLALIGPRPGLPVQLELFEAREERNIFSIRPGITGLAQINDVDMQNPAYLAEWDQRYLALRCISLDIKIALATATGSGQGDRVAIHSPPCEP